MYLHFWCDIKYSGYKPFFTGVILPIFSPKIAENGKNTYRAVAMATGNIFFFKVHFNNVQPNAFHLKQKKIFDRCQLS